MSEQLTLPGIAAEVDVQVGEHELLVLAGMMNVFEERRNQALENMPRGIKAILFERSERRIARVAAQHAEEQLGATERLLGSASKLSRGEERLPRYLAEKQMSFFLRYGLRKAYSEIKFGDSTVSDAEEFQMI